MTSASLPLRIPAPSGREGNDAQIQGTSASRSYTSVLDEHSLGLSPLPEHFRVTQRGHYDFDRVIKAGEAQKRTRKTKSWRTVYLVLRPGSLSLYRHANETKLRHKITLTDLTAVARQRDPKGRAKHVFGLFLPSRNYHLAAANDREAEEWVEHIRREARIDEEEGDLALASPGGQSESTYTGFGRIPNTRVTRQGTIESLAFSSSDAEAAQPEPHIMSTHESTIAQSARRPSTALDYSGPDNASYSDFSDLVGPTSRLSFLSTARPQPPSAIREGLTENESDVDAATRDEGLVVDNQRQLEDMKARASVAQMQAAARVICQGWVLLLKSHSGVKQWKKVWMVLRSPALAMYKNEKEYSALKIIPLSDILDAVEVDPISNSKRFCMQVITEDKSYRFCMSDEDSIARWLGSFKSLLVKRRERA